MDLDARKIEFVKEFLKLQSEETLSRLEKILHKEENISQAETFRPMSQDALNKRIDQSEADFQKNKFKSSKDLLAKYE